jgi:hypothetical protein
MRRFTLLLVTLTLVLAAGCNGEATTSTPSPSPSPTPVPETPTTVSPAGPTPVDSGPASCVEAPLEFNPEPRIPEVTEEDHVHGSVDAPITFIEYADFQ